ncbi:MAG: cell wall-binding repeat-containing protein [Microbacterium sp.]|uniref:cell wall-binding repeat-containing protein n=2 Tax=Microbacterium sp. TaxID=51671 RepID=UPI001AC43681|nr:cell wall-binding repeat-containing protein [Microbacterium sp.]MBN9154373.1 cell wall-binding repeat-containing protein [Microbacterium sp.]
MKSRYLAAIAAVASFMLMSIAGAAPADAAAPAQVHVHLVDSDGAPVQLAVWAVDANGTPVAGSTVGSGGDYTVTVLQPGRITLAASGTPGVINLDQQFPEQYFGGAYSAAGASLFDIAAGQTVDKTFVLRRGVRFSGTASADGVPVAAMNIRAVQSGLDYINRSFTTEAGAYRTEWLPEGTYQVAFDAGPRWDVITRTVTLAPGSDSIADIRFDVAAGIAGTVTMSNEPGAGYVANSIVRAYRPGDLGNAVGAAQPDGTGTYRINRLPAGDYLLKFTGGQYDLDKWWPNSRTAAGATLVHVAAHSTTPGIDAAIELGGVFVGVATVDLGGDPQPMAGMTVRIFQVDPTTGTRVEALGSPVTSGRDGIWISPVLPRGAYTFRYSHDSFPTYPALWYPGVSRAEDATTEDLELRSPPQQRPELRLEPPALVANRIAGADRFATAIQLGRAARQGTAPTVYIANGLNYPDALGAGPAAIADKGLLLLVMPDSLPPAVAAELRSLAPSRVVIVGGPAAVSNVVESAIRNTVGAKTPVQRFGGSTRYAVNDALIRSTFSSGSSIAYIATGSGFADALAAGAAAGHDHAPLILVDGSGHTLSASTAALLRDLDVERVNIVGGTGAVSSAIETDLRALLGTSAVRRLAGADRFATAVAVNSTIFADSPEAIVANGLGFPDALAATPLAGALDAPLFLVTSSCIPQSALDVMTSEGVARVRLAGGPAVLGTGIEQFRSCAPFG